MPGAPVPVGTLLFGGFGDSVMQFRSPAGVLLAAPVAMPVAGAGLGGLVALANGLVATTGVKAPLNGASSLNWGVFDTHLVALSGSVAGSGVSSIAANYASKFYAFLPCAAAGSVLIDGFQVRGNYKILQFGTTGLIQATYDLGFNDFPNLYALGVNAGETAAYYCQRVAGSTVSKVTLPGLVTTTFVTFAGWSVYDNGILVLQNGDVIVGWWKAGTAGSIRRYNSAGVLQQTTVLGVGFAPICLTPGLTDATFWCSYYSSAATFSGVTVTEFTTATGVATANTFDPVSGTFEYDGPFCVLRRILPGRDPQILRRDGSLTSDDGEVYEAFVKTRAIPPSGDITELGEIGEPATLVASAETGVPLTLTIDHDFGRRFQSSVLVLTPKAAETRVIRKFEAAASADIGAVQFKIGDATAVANSWELDHFAVPVIEEGKR